MNDFVILTKLYVKFNVLLIFSIVISML